MIGPEQGVPAEQFTLRNSQGKDIRFKGWKLAEVDSYNPDAVDKLTGRATGSNRWKERAVYQTEGGRIVCHKLGRSNVPGEVDRGEVLLGRTDEDEILAHKFTYQADQKGPPKAPSAESQIVQFFENDPLAKDLFAALGIEDVQEIE